MKFWINSSYYSVREFYFEHINENECAYLYYMSGEFTDMDNIDFTTDDRRLRNPMDIEIDDWDVRMFTIVQLTMRLLYQLK